MAHYYIHVCMYMCEYRSHIFPSRPTVTFQVTDDSSLQFFTFPFWLQFLKRSLHKWNFLRLAFAQKQRFFTPRLENKFFSGFFSHVEKQEKKKLVFCCLNKIDLLYFTFFSEQTTGAWLNAWLSVGYEMRTEP